MVMEEENYEKNTYSTKRDSRRKGRQVFSLVIIILFVVSTMVVGAVGGVAGFVLLSNSDSSTARYIRNAVGLDDESKVAIPVKQNVKVEESSALIDAAKKVAPAVVSITASQNVMDFFGNSLGNQEVGGGSGFILTSDGLIATNRHVVTSAAGASLKVVLNDGRMFDAKVQATDTINDFAVLKIDAKDLPTVEFGSSDGLQIGQTVMAIGNALGEFKNSVTTGVVSAKGRRLDAGSQSSSQSETLTDLIQTDAAINPGNSGGPLVNILGQVVGVNTAIATTSGGSVGIGFALPIDSLISVIDSVRSTGSIVRPYIGVRYIPVNKTVQKINNLSVDYGALVSRGNGINEVAVMSGSPADKAGIVENDIILEVNGERIDEDNPISKRIAKYSVGDEVSIKLLHKGEEKTVKVKLEKLNQ